MMFSTMEAPELYNTHLQAVRSLQYNSNPQKGESASAFASQLV